MQERTELTMAVEGMTCAGCAKAVARTIRQLDPEADVAVDLDRGRVGVMTRARSLDIAQALGKAGYTATATTDRAG